MPPSPSPTLLPIRTREPRAPWPWVAAMAAPWGVMVFLEQVSSQILTFKLREFVAVPLIITLVGSLNTVFNILVGASVNFASDRIWTPWGRRRPFILAGWAANALMLLVFPGISSFWLLVVAIFFYEMLRDSTSPYESLQNEVVPPAQRGRSASLTNMVRQLTVMGFFAFVIGLYDRTFQVPLFGTLTGPQAIFWGSALLVSIPLAFVAFAVRETPPPEAASLGRLRLPRASDIGHFLKEVFGDPHRRPLLIVGLAQMTFGIGFGSLAPLLYTEQWGFSKQQYGTMVAIGSPFLIFGFVPLGGFLSDRVSRLFILKLGACWMVVHPLLTFAYVKLLAPGGIPSMTFLVVWGVITAGVGTTCAVATAPLVLDYVPRSQFGTLFSGLGFARGVAVILINNGIGFWVTLGSTWMLGLTTYDYTLGYLYLAGVAVLCAWGVFWFARLDASGRLPKLGRMEQG